MITAEIKHFPEPGAFRILTLAVRHNGQQHTAVSVNNIETTITIYSPTDADLAAIEKAISAERRRIAIFNAPRLEIEAAYGR